MASPEESLYLLHTLEVTRRDAEEVERRVRERTTRRRDRITQPQFSLELLTRERLPAPPQVPSFVCEQRLVRSEAPTLRMRAASVPPESTRYSIIRGRSSVPVGAEAEEEE